MVISPSRNELRKAVLELETSMLRQLVIFDKVSYIHFLYQKDPKINTIWKCADNVAFTLISFCVIFKVYRARKKYKRKLKMYNSRQP